MSKFTKPKIDPEFLNFYPVPTKAERAGLRESIAAEGVRDAVVVWQEANILLDGHTRVAVSDELRMPYPPIEYLSFASRDDARLWILKNQLVRRNLTDEKKKYYVGKLYQAEQAKLSNVQPSSNTAADVAAATGTSKRTVHRNRKYASAVDLIGQVDPAKKKAILAGGTGLTEEEVIEMAPPSCERCWRIGPHPTSVCPECVRMRSGKTKAKPKKAGSKAPDKNLVRVLGVLARLKSVKRDAEILLGGEWADHLKKAARDEAAHILTKKAQPDPLVEKYEQIVDWPTLNRIIDTFAALRREMTV